MMTIMEKVSQPTEAMEHGSVSETTLLSFLESTTEEKWTWKILLLYNKVFVVSILMVGAFCLDCLRRLTGL